MDELLRKWRVLHDEREAATAPLREAVAALNAEMSDVALAFEPAMSELEAQIHDLALERGTTYKNDKIGVQVAYRNGQHRVTYDWRAVDQVRNVLRDVLPQTAQTLDAARTETTGEPSVTVKAL